MSNNNNNNNPNNNNLNQPLVLTWYDVRTTLEHLVMIGNEKRSWYERISTAADQQTNNYNNNNNNNNVQSKRRRKVATIATTPGSDNDTNTTNATLLSSFLQRLVRSYTPSSDTIVQYIKQQLREQILSNVISIKEIPERCKVITDSIRRSIELFQSDNIHLFESILSNEKITTTNDDIKIEQYFRTLSERMILHPTVVLSKSMMQSSDNIHGNNNITNNNTTANNNESVELLLTVQTNALIYIYKLYKKEYDQYTQQVQDQEQKEMERKRQRHEKKEQSMTYRKRQQRLKRRKLLVLDDSSDKNSDDDDDNNGDDSSSSVESSSEASSSVSSELSKQHWIHTSDERLYQTYTKEEITSTDRLLPRLPRSPRIQPLYNNRPYDNELTDFANLQTHPISFYQDQLSLLLQPPSPPYPVSLSNQCNQYYSTNNDGTVKVVQPVQSMHDGDDDSGSSSNPDRILQQNPCRGLLLHCWERAVSIASSTVVVNVPSSDLTRATNEKGMIHRNEITHVPIVQQHQQQQQVHETSSFNATDTMKMPAHSNQERTAEEPNQQTTADESKRAFEGGTTTEARPNGTNDDDDDFQNIQQATSYLATTTGSVPVIINNDTNNTPRNRVDPIAETILTGTYRRETDNEASTPLHSPLPMSTVVTYSDYLRTVCERLRINLQNNNDGTIKDKSNNNKQLMKQKSMTKVTNTRATRKSPRVRSVVNRSGGLDDNTSSDDTSDNDSISDSDDNNGATKKKGAAVRVKIPLRNTKGIRPSMDINFSTNLSSPIPGSVPIGTTLEETTYTCPVCTVRFPTFQKLENHYYNDNVNATKIMTHEEDLSTVCQVAGIGSQDGSCCSERRIYKTRCDLLAKVLLRDVDVQVKQVLQLIFRDTINHQIKNGPPIQEARTLRKKPRKLTIFQKEILEAANKNNNNNDDDEDEEKCLTSDDEEVRSDPEYTTKTGEDRSKNNSNPSQEQPSKNQLREVYDWKFVLNIFEQRLEQSKQVQDILDERSRKHAKLQKRIPRQPGRPKKKQQVEQERDGGSEDTLDRHPVLETLQAFPSMAPLLVNPMIIQVVRNRILDRYSSLPR